MSKHYSKAKLQSVAVELPVTSIANRAQRVLGLHPALFAITIGSYFTFFAVMAAAFMNPNLVVPFVIFIAYVVMAFGVPGLWAHVRGPDVGSFQTWAQFRNEGMDIETGHIGSGAAIAQVITLPVLIAAWAIAIAVVVALV